MTGGTSHERLSRVLVIGSYVSLGALLIWSRVYALGRGGFCCDEIFTVETYVRGGPDVILAGAYIPNNHQLYSLVGWATSSLFGESESLLRVGAAAPFVAGVAVVTVWLHKRVGALAALLFLTLATVAPLLLDLSRQARGYGIAFFAMSLVTVAALETARTRRRWPIAALCLGGVLGALTLPHFAVSFVAVALALVVLDIRRRLVALAVAVVLVASAAWYAPHADDILDSSRQAYAVEITSTWVLTAPIDQTLVPAFTLLADDYLHPNLASLALVVLFALVMAGSPLLRVRSSALILVSPVVATIVAFWLTGTHAAPRFFSYLLVPLLVLVATGAAGSVTRLETTRARGQAMAGATLLLVVVFASAPSIARIPTQPRESMRQVAEALDEARAESSPVIAYVFHPGDLEFHLGRVVTPARTADDLASACSRPEQVVIVTQAWMLEPLAPPCSERRGTRHTRLEQYARGGRIDVWIVPAAESDA
jgi:hypothetical protein